MKDLSPKSEALFDQFLEENGNSRVIAANYHIMQLIQAILVTEQQPAWHDVSEIDEFSDCPRTTEVVIQTNITTRLGILGDIELEGSTYRMRGANEAALKFLIIGKP